MSNGGGFKDSGNKASTDKQNATVASAMVDKKHGATDEKKDNTEEEERQKTILKEYKVPMGRVLGYCKKEWPLLFPGVLGAL